MAGPALTPLTSEAASSTPPEVNDEQAERVRTRVRLLVQLTTRAGRYRRGLVQAAAGLTPYEAAVLADLEDHSLDVNQLRDVLCGGHVLVDDPALYERWRFPSVSRQRLSSHHKTVDKKLYPDIGMRGPLVREKLHGRTATGTWVQLEKTPASFGGARRLPSWSDLAHLADYVVYRITHSNVGPWGLSGLTERRPMYLSPDLRALVPLPSGTARSLARTLTRLDEEDNAAVQPAGLAARFPPPERADARDELLANPDRGRGRGLFSSSQVWVTETAAAMARRVLAAPPLPPDWSLPAAGETRPIELTVGDHRLVLAGRVGTTAAAPSSSSSSS